MKRYLLILLGGLLLAEPVTAQITNFIQRGKAVQELNSPGLSAAHPSLPINSRATVRNTLNGREIEVTITGRITASANRAIDLSRGAWEALGLSPETDVIITTIAPPRPRPIETAVQPPPDRPSTTEEVPAALAAAELPAGGPVPAEEGLEIAEAAEQTQPYTIIINNYITPAEEMPPKAASTSVTAPIDTTTIPGYLGVNSDFLAWLMALDAREGREFREGREYRDARGVRDGDSRDAAPLQQQPQLQPQQPAQVIQPQQPVVIQPQQPVQVIQSPGASPVNIYQSPYPQIAGIEVIPGWPNPYTNRIYRIQVGSFSSPEAAATTEQQARTAGFITSREMYGSMHRVLVLNISAAEVYNSVVRLVNVGLRQFWIRD